MKQNLDSSTHSFVLLVLFSLILSFQLSPLQAQDFGSPTSVSGEVSSDGDVPLAGLRIEFRSTWGGDPLRSDVRPDGTFQITSFQPLASRYMMELRDRDRNVVYSDFVQLASFPLKIHITAPKKERPITGLVSVDELMHPVPKKARKEYQRGLKASEKGDIQLAIEHLQKATEIAPGFVEAHNGLGVKWMLLGDYTKALISFEEAVRLRPESSQPLSNLAMALHSLNRDDEAEPIMRRALQLEPGSIRSKYALALVLIGKGRHDNEPMQILHDVAAEIPEAHLQTAGVLARQANYREAKREVQAYLASGDKTHRERANQWLHTLQPLASSE